jgi:hypothetical protein
LTPNAKPDRLLAIYLNDHLAGATVGVELARRLRSSNADDPAMADPLGEVCSEIETDRATLEHVMERLGVRRRRVKAAGAWTAEKLGRLKFNGQLTGYSPLSRLVELELLYIGITGKLRLWKALEHSLGDSRGEFASRSWPNGRRASARPSRRSTSTPRAWRSPPRRPDRLSTYRGVLRRLPRRAAPGDGE